MNKVRIAYISPLIYPSPTAQGLQTIQMAAAFARQTSDTHLFVRSLVASREQVRQQYAAGGSSLRIWSLHVDFLRSFLRRRYMHNYNSAIAVILALHPAWWRASRRRKVLFVRSRREFLYWGLARPRLWWLRDWIFVYEAHDVAGLDPEASLENNPFDLQTGPEAQLRQRHLQAMCNFDLLLTVTQELADDLSRWSNGMLQPHVVRHASALPRLPRLPELHAFGSRVVLGYVGAIDQERGVDSLVAAMRGLSDRFMLRLVGRFREPIASGQRPAWLSVLLNDPAIRTKVELVPPVPVGQVAEEIDRCDILLQPASDHVISLRYRAPLKLFDYMVRGKPIIAADVPCHKELLQDGVNACLYRYDDVEHLAACIKSLAEQPRQAAAIARVAWEQAAGYSYDARARRILELVDEVWEHRQAGCSSQ